MKLFPKQIDQRTKEAMYFFWTTRLGQIQRQSDSSVRDQGNRGAVTGGKQLDGMVTLIRDVIIENGIDENSIFFNTNLELPGFYRPNKKWDLLVVQDDILIIAIELKSQVGPSFGNNFNNRTEEAIGNAVDIWTAYREGVFGTKQSPWLGYMMVLEESEKSTEPVNTRSPHFEIMPEFIRSSYKKRYELFCKKLMLERQYNSTCLITTKNDKNNLGNYKCPVDDLSVIFFLSSMVAAIKAYNA